MGLLLTFCFVMQTTDAMGMPPKKKNRGAAKAATKVAPKLKADDIEKERQAEAARKAKAEAERLEKERQAADLKRQEAADKALREVTRQEEDKRQKEEADRQAEAARVVRVNRGATAIQSAFRGHKDRQLIVKPLRIEKQQDDALVTNFLGWLGNPKTALTPGSREARLVSWVTGSYNVFNQTHPDYTFVKNQLKADQYGDLFDLVVSFRAHNPLDGHANNSWILKAIEMGDDDLSAAVKLVRQCSAVLDGKDIDDEVSKAIDAMMADTLATGGRIGIDLHRQATDAEMLVMIRALRMSGQRVLALAKKDGKDGNALEELAKTYLDAPFKSQKGDTSSRVIEYLDDELSKLFNSHKAHCFMAAATVKDSTITDGDIEAVLSKRDFDVGALNVRATRADYDAFDVGR